MIKNRADGGAGIIPALLQLNDLLARGVKVRILLIAILSVIFGVMETVGIIMVLPLVDLAAGNNNLPGFANRLTSYLGVGDTRGTGVLLVCLVVGIFILKDVGTIWFNFWKARFISTERAATQVQMMQGYMSLPWQDYRGRTTAEMVRTIHDAVSRVYGSVVGGFISLIASAFTVLSILVALFAAIPLQALIIMLYFAFGATLYMRFIKPRTLKVGKEIMEASVQGYVAAFDGLAGYKEITLRHTEGYFVEKYRIAANRDAAANATAEFYTSIPKFLLEILFISAVGILLLYMFLVGDQGQAVGTMALLVAAGFRLLPNVSAIISAINNVRLGSESLDIISQENKVIKAGSILSEGFSKRLGYKHQIVLEDVHFRYNGSDCDVLNGVSLNIPYGSSVAFVGGSGAGKTTLVDIILGLLSPTSGKVLVDGYDISSDVRGWQENVAMVSQEVYVSNASVLQNIVFDKPSGCVEEKRLLTTVERAQLKDLISNLPEGMETLCGERGGRLSGGQRQRIGIARALYREPSLLVLDEATSALDNETEKKITDTIDALGGDVTVVVVAHRLSTVKNVDQVVYLENGKVSGVGSFRELQKTNEKFAQLVALGKLD
ncbi:ABC transporter ATP-binding protein/permease [Dermabacteraceae bacterium TAE3-ERU27]|nr:ABC transporter ATP-binding protein/permease [Dermabacteraceae bacterium TAE3-ERU27]